MRTYQHESNHGAAFLRSPIQLVAYRHHQEELEPYCLYQGRHPRDLRWFQGKGSYKPGSNKRKPGFPPAVDFLSLVSLHISKTDTTFK